MNKIIIIGNLTKDPELSTTLSGKSVCRMSIAVKRSFKTKDGPEADFFNITAWGATGENCSRYLTKGKKISVVGELHIDTYKDKNDNTRYSVTVQASEIEFLTPKGEVKEESGNTTVNSVDENGFADVNTADLPF